MIHALYDTIRIRGTATSHLTSGAEEPYVGAITVWVLPPGATDPTAHETTSDIDGNWHVIIDSDHAGYAAGTWRYCARAGTTVHGGTFDNTFRVLTSFAPLTPPGP